MQKNIGVSVHPYRRYADPSFVGDLEEVSTSDVVDELYAVTAEGKRSDLVGEDYFDGFLDDYNGHGGLTSRELGEIPEYDTAYVFGFYVHDCVLGTVESLMKNGFETAVLEEHSYTSENDELYSLDERNELENPDYLLKSLYTVAPRTVADL